MTVMKKASRLLFMIFLSVGCQHLERRPSDLSSGMTKSEVLERWTGPRHTRRRSGTEFWIYSQSQKETDKKLVLLFKKNRLAEVRLLESETPLYYLDADEDLTDAERHDKIQYEWGEFSRLDKNRTL
jgi:hypothetical protein